MLRYLEIDSTYRNRTQYPNQASFDLLISQSVSGSAREAKDPISLASPIVVYQSSTIGSIVSTTAPVGNTNSSDSFIVRFNASLNASKESNYYRGIQAQINAGATDMGRVTILSWDYLNTKNTPPLQDCFRITFTPDINATLIPSITNFALISSTSYAQGLVFIPKGVFSTQEYKNYYIYNETRKQSALILAYDGSNALASVDANATVVAWASADVINLRQELPQDTGAVLAGSTSSLINLAVTANPTTDSLTGSFLRFTSGALNNQTRRIIAYSGSVLFQATVNPSFSTAPGAGDTYEILAFTRDIYSPFTYSGSFIQQDYCYEVQLVNLLLPNVALQDGGLMASYPYFYVEFRNISSGGMGFHITSSNNPNGLRSMFRIPVSDVASSTQKSFLTLDKCYMAQTVRINPYGNFKFAIYLPNGEVLQTSLTDTSSPLPPDKYLQISAVFALRRMPTNI